MSALGLRTRLAPLAVATALVGGLVATTTATAPEAHAAGGSYYLYFKKNTSNPINSKLYLMKSVANAKDKVVAKYRAGSGNGSQNECALSGDGSRGPTRRTASTRSSSTARTSTASSTATSSSCRTRSASKGTKRTELFVHSEMKPNGRQGTIESERWDGTRDYYSNGCIKLKPADIKNLFAKAKRYGWPKTLYVVEVDLEGAAGGGRGVRASARAPTSANRAPSGSATVATRPWSESWGRVRTCRRGGRPGPPPRPCRPPRSTSSSAGPGRGAGRRPRRGWRRRGGRPRCRVT